MKMYKVFVVMSIVILGLLLVMMVRSPQKHTNNQLVVGMMSGWAPFMSINGSGEYEGFDIDVAREIARRINKKVVIQDLGSLAACFIALDQQRVDMIMSGLDITQKRCDTFNMVYYTGNTTTSFDLVFWDTIPEKIKSMEDMRNVSDAVICVESGSAQERFLDSYGFVTKKRMNSLVDIVLDLRFGKSLAAIIEPRIAARLARQNPELRLLPVPLPPAFQVFGCGIAIRKNNNILAEEVTRVVQEMIADKTMKKLEQKWQLEE